MTSAWVVTVFSSFLILGGLPRPSQTYSDFHFHDTLQSTGGNKNVEKRSVLTFPPDSVFQINMGVTLSGQFERNNAVIVLAMQQNGPLPSESLPLLSSPSVVVEARKSSIFHHLRDVISSYGFNGSECLRKMVCQIGETPLLGGLVEDVITFALSPSKHRSSQFSPGTERTYLDSLLESERLGKLGGNCSSAYPNCAKTPLDLVSALVRV